MTDDKKERYINPYTDFGFKKLFGTEMNKDTVDERRQYEASLKEYWDYTSTMDTAYMKGERKGLEKGRAEGREEGRAEGREEGREEERQSMARRMKADGVSAETIARYTGLTVDEVNAL